MAGLVYAPETELDAAALAVTVALATPLAFVVSNLVVARSETVRAAFAGWMPAPEESIATAAVFRDVVMIPFTTRTAETLAANQELPGFEPDAQRGSYRPMHAAAIERLAELGAETIAMDVFFSTTNDKHDNRLASAIEAAHETGSTVVLGVRSWELAGGRLDRLGAVLEIAGDEGRLAAVAHAGAARPADRYVAGLGELEQAGVVRAPWDGEVAAGELDRRAGSRSAGGCISDSRHWRRDAGRRRIGSAPG